MRSRFQGQHVCYDPVSDDNNPYPAFMHDAEFVITTSDSTSMCSEIASTGKPNYVFYRENCNKKKCDLLLNQLIEAGKARKLEMNTERLEVFEYEPLSEIDRVVEKVKRELIESDV